MVIKVTAQDIKNGKHGSCYLCPVALAAKRAFGKVVHVSSYQVRIIRGPGIYTTAALPPEAHRFVNAFDDFRDVSPFSFKLRIGAA